MPAWQTLQKAECATSDTKFRLLCGQCLAECNEYDQCLALLGDDDLQQILPDDSPGAEPRHARPVWCACRVDQLPHWPMPANRGGGWF